MSCASGPHKTVAFLLSRLMASNAPGQSTYSLGPRVSLDGGAPIFAVGECILIRIPGQIQVEGYVEDEASAIGTNLPPVSEGAGPQHLAFIREVHRVRRQRSFILEVYPVLAFSNTGGAVATYNNMSNPATKAALLPLPLLSSRHPTPDAFGEPLSFGNWTTIRDSFLHVFPRRLIMPMSRSVSLLLMINSFFFITIKFSLNEWSLPSLCLWSCCFESMITENTS